MKKLRFVRIVLCLALVATMLFGNMGSIFLQIDLPQTAFAATAEDDSTLDTQDEGVVRPEDLDEGLSVKSLQDIRGRRVTLRQPVMEVLDYNVDRTPAEEMEDTFTFIDPTTGKFSDVKGAQIDFTDRSVTHNPSEQYNYPQLGLDKVAGKYFSNFTKYMLLRQAWYYNANAMDLAKENKLFKHPAADGIYGKISDDAPAVKMHMITDPIYRSPMTTGLYLVAGEAATLTVKGLKKGETLTLYTHHQDSLAYQGSYENSAVPNNLSAIDKYFYYWDNQLLDEAKRANEAGTSADYSKLDFGLQSQWAAQNQKVPCMGATFTIVGTGEDMEVKIGSIYGGPLYVKPTESAVDMVITGAVLTPHFVLGVTTVQEFEQHLRTAPGLIATLDVENGQLIGPAEDMRNCDDIEKLSYFWHSVFAINISLNGRAYNYNITMKYDIHVPAGEAVALGSDTCAQPTYWFPRCMNYGLLTSSGNWGTFHELGHVQAKTFNGVNWGMCGDGEGEVWNNTLIILMYSLLCNMDNRLTRLDDHGEFAHPYTAIQRSINVSQTTRDGSPIQDYNDYDKASGQYFDQLSLYSTIIHSFGPSKFVDFFYTYNLNPAYCANKRADFVYRMGLVDHVNMLPWINEFYHGNISESDYTAEQWNFLQTLPTFYPIAFRWANGVDGNETARKYEVDGKTSTVFDLSGDNIICPKSFTVDGVSSAEHGNVSYDATEKQVTYTPPTDVTEFDGFDIYVTTEGGRRVTLNVRFALLYRSSYTEVWDITELGGKPTVQNALDYIEQHDLTPYSTQSSGVAGTTFTRDKIEYLHLRFKFLAQTDGVYKFYIRADDASQVDFYKDGFNEQSLKTLSTSKDSSKYTDNGEFEYEMKAGDMLYVDGKLVNWGGLGYISVGVKFPDTDTIVEIPQENLVSPFVTSEELAQADSFEGWQPRFVDSIKNTVIDHKSEKDGWQVIKYPAGQPNDGNSADCMVDGNEDNFFHVQYSGANVPQYPHEFVFDMGVEQTVNYFEILRRGIGNERIYEMKLYGAQDGSVDEHGNELTDGAFKELFNGNVSNSNDRRYRVRFKDQSLRYFKLVVVRTQNVTVINEVYAGQEAQLSQTIKPSNYQKANDGFEENSANGKLSTETVGAFYEFEFLGTGFDIFADTSPDYGAAKVTVDGEQSGVIDLNVNAAFNKCVYKWSDTKAAQHTVRIETTSAGKFNISFINVNYGTPVGKDDYPALKKADGTEDYGNESVNRIFSRDWRTVVKDYKTLTSIRFVKSAPEGYEDTFERMDTFIRIYRNAQNYSELAFVYPGGIVSPSDCGSLFAGCAALEEIVLDNFDTTSMQGAVSMFNGCTSLRYVNAGKLNTENALWLGKMFANCSILTTVDIGGATIADGANIFGMFDGCVELDQIILPSNIGQNVYGELPGVYLDTTAERYVRSLTAANAGHTLKLHANHTAGTQHQKIEPTCTQTGMSEYYDCAECGFACVGGEYRTESSLVLQALGHEPVPYLDYELPTCSHPGHDIGLMCDRCGEVLYQGDEIPALPHTEEVTEGKAPTCTQKGLSDGSHCSVCGETLIEQQELAALEHTPEVLRGKAATATEKGLTDGLRCSVCGEILQAQSEIPALGTADTDNLNMTAIILGTLGGALLLSALAVTVIVLVRRRKN